MSEFDTNKDYYAILGVSDNAGQTTIDAAWRKKVKQYHPDRNPDASAKQKFQEVQEAREVLIDPVRRKKYDTQRNANSANAQQSSQSKRSSTRPHHNSQTRHRDAHGDTQHQKRAQDKQSDETPREPHKHHDTFRNQAENFSGADTMYRANQEANHQPTRPKGGKKEALFILILILVSSSGIGASLVIGPSPALKEAFAWLQSQTNRIETLITAQVQIPAAFTSIENSKNSEAAHPSFHAPTAQKNAPGNDHSKAQKTPIPSAPDLASDKRPLADHSKPLAADTSVPQLKNSSANSESQSISNSGSDKTRPSSPGIASPKQEAEKQRPRSSSAPIGETHNKQSPADDLLDIGPLDAVVIDTAHLLIKTVSGQEKIRLHGIGGRKDALRIQTLQKLIHEHGGLRCELIKRRRTGKDYRCFTKLPFDGSIADLAAVLLYNDAAYITVDAPPRYREIAASSKRRGNQKN